MPCSRSFLSVKKGRLSALTTHLKKLLISSSDSNGVPDVINSRQLDIDSCSDCLNRHITLTEIQKSLRQLKNKTSVGFDRISIEMLKQSSPQLLECINKLFNIILTQRQYPDQWRDNILKPLCKGGDDKNPENYRRIVISSCLSKLFSRILHNRLENFITQNDVLLENQIGFRKSYRTGDHILTLKAVIDICFKKSSHLDLKKAFHTVWREALFRKLESCNINGNILDTIKSMYSEVNYSIKLPYGLADPVKSKKGVKQGCVLRTLLFNLYINDLPDIFEESCDPVMLQSFRSNVMMYAVCRRLTAVANKRRISKMFR